MCFTMALNKIYYGFKAALIPSFNRYNRDETSIRELQPPF